jgi:hypothetical protein
LRTSTPKTQFLALKDYDEHDQEYVSMLLFSETPYTYRQWQSRVRKAMKRWQELDELEVQEEGDGISEGEWSSFMTQSRERFIAHLMGLTPLDLTLVNIQE